MKALTEDENVDIDINISDVVMYIDDIFHENITDRTRLTVSHDDIYAFVINIINDNNVRILKIRTEEKRISELMKANEKAFHEKVDAGKTIKNLNGIRNKFKFYILNYILVNDNIEMETIK